jgi:hypothetical protein
VKMYSYDSGLSKLVQRCATEIDPLRADGL